MIPVEQRERERAVGGAGGGSERSVQRIVCGLSNIEGDIKRGGGSAPGAGNVRRLGIDLSAELESVTPEGGILRGLSLRRPARAVHDLDGMNDERLVEITETAGAA